MPSEAIRCGSADAVRWFDKTISPETIAELAGVIRLQFRSPLMNQACVSVSIMAVEHAHANAVGVFSIRMNVTTWLLLQLKYIAIPEKEIYV